MSTEKKLEETSKKILGYVPSNIDDYVPLNMSYTIQTLKTQAQYNNSDWEYSGGSLSDMPIREPYNYIKRATSENIQPVPVYRPTDNSISNSYSMSRIYTRTSKDIIEELKKNNDY